MKKIAVCLVAFAAAAFISSCEKEGDKTITKTIAVTLSPGATYTTNVVQTGDEDGILQITQQASHAAVSQLTPVSGSKDATFTYTPASQYVGTDEVQISTSEGDHQGNGGGHGNCSGHHHHDDENTVYVYKITLTGNNH